MTPPAVEQPAALANRRLEALLEADAGRWSSVAPEMAEPFAALRDYVMAGGKRLRPAFCYWAYVGAGGAPGDPLLSDALGSLEMLHTAALIHDDIIDGSSRRHGSETVHVRLGASHERRGWSGSARRFGQGTAILVGDLALVYSSRLMARAPAAALDLFEEMRLEVNVGQYLDVVGTAAGPTGASGVDRARLICRYKTAKYTVERPMHIGAALAAPGRVNGLTGPISAFALPLGEAFQLRDDLLDVFGDPSATGKPVGDDLREGKPTLLAALAADTGPADSRRRFVSRLGDRGLSPEDLEEMRLHIERSGARRRVEETIAELLGAARQAMNALPLTAPARAALSELADFVGGRDR